MTCTAMWGDPSNSPTFVYMMRTGDSVKIGFSRDPFSRRHGLSSGMPSTLEILRIFIGLRSDEKALHKKFAHLHIKGEWFRMSEELLGDVGLGEITKEELAMILSQPEVPFEATREEKHAWRQACRIAKADSGSATDIFQQIMGVSA